LDPEGFIEAELDVDGGDILGTGARFNHQTGGIAGQAHEQEDG
jgi:hypothetical protein